MAKFKKSDYTKEEAARLMRARRDEKRLKKLQKQAKESTLPDTNEYTFLCVKHGVKYDAEYVNKLYNMVKRNCTFDVEFICLTDNTKDLHQDIQTRPLPPFLQGWWCKPYIFAKELNLKGTVLYMDLDVVIAGSIDKLFTYMPGQWCTIRDFTRAMRKDWRKYNSSILKFEAGSLDFIWKDFSRDPRAIQRKFFGDQDYLYEITKNKPASLYPDTWIQSWKWEVRKSKEFEPGGRKGHKKLRYVEDVTPRIECCVCVFHGDPNPANCEDPWVVKNWK